MIVKVYLAGLALLAGALLINVVAGLLKLPSWYDFLADFKLTPASFIWLFIIYPFLLGLLVFLLKRFFN